jgi:hypothetical protein
MPQHRLSLNTRASLLAAIAAAYPVIGYAAPAAQVDFAVGNVTAVGSNGQSRALGKGAKVEQGDTVNTNGGRAQLRFTDGAYVSLQPESQFRIDQYRFEGKQDGNEKGFFSLLKGGLRTITGLVGRSNKANYQVTTSVATIGIRGTEYTIQYGQSITGTVGEGEINVCNSAGCLNVTNGESYYVQGDQIKPVLTNKRTDLPPPEPTQPPLDFKMSDCYDASGNPCTLFPPISGRNNLHVATNSNGVILNTDAVVSAGQLISFDYYGSPVSLNGPFQDVGGDSIILWGLAANCSGGECGGKTPYVAGIPADLSGVYGTATYTLLGATRIVDYSGNDIGNLTAADMTVNLFSGSASGTMTMNMTLLGQARTASGISVSGCGASFYLSGCSGNMSLYGQGFFAGTNALRAGFAYSVYDNQLEISGKGAAALRQTSLQNIPQ